VANIAITVDDAELRAAFGQLLQKTANVKPALKDIGEYLLRVTDDRFAAEQAPDGTPWTPLSEETIALDYLRRGKNRTLTTKRGATSKGYAQFKARRKILDSSGNLRGSIRYQVEPDGLAVGSNLIYANVHQFGAVIRAKNAKALAIPQPDGSVRLVQSVKIPARPFLGVTPRDRQEILEILKRHLGGSAR
jgi:phage virion morphogenesis protein